MEEGLSYCVVIACCDFHSVFRVVKWTWEQGEPVLVFYLHLNACVAFGEVMQLLWFYNIEKREREEEGFLLPLLPSSFFFFLLPSFFLLLFLPSFFLLSSSFFFSSSSSSNMRGLTTCLYADGNDLIVIEVIDYFYKHSKAIAMSRQV